MQQVATVILYGQLDCFGQWIEWPDPTGSFFSTEFAHNKSVRSMMVWESGTYSTRGPQYH
jgi:hypothetical protein